MRVMAGDANAFAAALIMPAEAVDGRVTIAVPLLGFLLTVLSQPSGVVGPLGLGCALITMIVLVAGRGPPERGPERTATRARAGIGEAPTT